MDCAMLAVMTLYERFHSWLLEQLKNGVLQRYIFSGVTAVAADLFILYALTDFFHLWYLLSSVLALGVGFIVSFVMQKFWTFRNKSMERVHIQFTLHVLLSILNIGLNTVFLFGLVEYLSLQYILAQILSTSVLAGMNYFIFQKYIFTSTVASISS